MPSKNTYYIGKLKFTTQVKAKEYAKHIISDIGVGEVKAKDCHYNFMCDLLKNHPERREKIGKGIVSFIISQNSIRPLDRNNNPIYHIDIKRTDGSKMDFSWVKCATSKKGSSTEDLNQVFRYAVREQTYTFRRLNPKICALCNTHGLQEYHTDHKSTSFKEIVEDFLIENTKPIPTCFTEDSKTHQTIFKQDDSEFEGNWKQYHKKRADYQLLCRDCNLKKG